MIDITKNGEKPKNLTEALLDVLQLRENIQYSERRKAELQKLYEETKAKVLKNQVTQTDLDKFNKLKAMNAVALQQFEDEPQLLKNIETYAAGLMTDLEGKSFVFTRKAEKKQIQDRDYEAWLADGNLHVDLFKY